MLGNHTRSIHWELLSYEAHVMYPADGWVRAFPLEAWLFHADPLARDYLEQSNDTKRQKGWEIISIIVKGGHTSDVIFEGQRTESSENRGTSI